jgi:hypothetical protein
LVLNALGERPWVDTALLRLLLLWHLLDLLLLLNMLLGLWVRRWNQSWILLSWVCLEVVALAWKPEAIPKLRSMSVILIVVVQRNFRVCSVVDQTG